MVYELNGRENLYIRKCIYSNITNNSKKRNSGKQQLAQCYKYLKKYAYQIKRKTSFSKMQLALTLTSIMNPGLLGTQTYS